MAIKNQKRNIIDAFAGINNIDPHSALQINELTKATNVDIDGKFKVTRRNGYTKKYAGTNIHSLWSNQIVSLFVEDGTLKQLKSDYSAVDIRTNVSRFGKMYYVDINGDIYFSDGKVLGVYREGDQYTFASTPIPPTRPVLATSTDGALPAGRYGVTFTAVDSSGRESGATYSTYVDLPDGGSIQVTNIPATLEGAASINVYITDVNRANYNLYTTVALGAATVNIDTTPSFQSGGGLRTQFLEAMPAGAHLEEWGGRLFIAVNNVLYYSMPYQYGMTNLYTNYIMMPERITMVQAVGNTLFISAGKTYALQGQNPQESSMREVADYPAIEGTNVKVDQRVFGAEGQAGMVAMWMSEAGLCAGLEGGAFRNITETKYVPRTGDLGNALFRQQDGKNQYIGVVRPDDGEISRVYTSDVATAEIYRNGVLIT